MTGPAYTAVVVLHVLAAVVGFGALGATGSYASALRRRPGSAGSAAIRRFFRPGRNWAARTLLLVPLLGGALLGLGHGQDVGQAFPWIGLAIWVVAAGVASAVLWPAEREIQRLVAAGGSPGGGNEAALEVACARCERAAAVTSLLFVAGLGVMIAQP